jgi:hypothetical protein
MPRQSLGSKLRAFLAETEEAVMPPGGLQSNANELPASPGVIARVRRPRTVAARTASRRTVRKHANGGDSVD